MTAALLAYEFGEGLAFAALAMWIFVWLLVAWRVIRRHDIGVGAKVLWIVIILVIPLLGALRLLPVGRDEDEARLTRGSDLDGEGGIRTLEAGIFPT